MYAIRSYYEEVPSSVTPIVEKPVFCFNATISLRVCSGVKS